MSDEGRHPAGGVPSVTGWDGESAAKRSRHVDAGEPHQEGDEFVGRLAIFEHLHLDNCAFVVGKDFKVSKSSALQGAPGGSGGLRALVQPLRKAFNFDTRGWDDGGS